MSSTLHVRIPMERVGVLIGPNGSVKKEIEATL
ncbi:RNA-processing protein, partial [Candidatus Bathyarchaeota archaeon]